MRPVLKSGLRTVWRNAATVQVGLDPRRAVVIGGLGRGDARLLAALDGTRDVSQLHALAASLGVDDSRVDRLLRLLGEVDALADAGAPTGSWAELDAAERDRLTPDLAAAALVGRGERSGTELYRRRRAAVLLVHGAGRVGAAVAALAGAAGIGRIAVHDDAEVRSSDVSPAGVPATAVGSRRTAAVAEAIVRAAPSTRVGALLRHERPDLVVLAPAAALLPGAGDAWLRADVPHLYAGVRETTGIVGPLVLPGSSSCLRCADLHRTDRDREWPLVAVQASDPLATEACDAGLATLVAAQAVMQVLALVDGAVTAAAVGATLETDFPGGITRRRSWALHPACGCHWPMFRPEPPAARSGPPATIEVTAAPASGRGGQRPETMAG